MSRITGNYEYNGNVECFIPLPLPPSNPPLQMSQEIIALYGQTMNNLGQLNSTIYQLPDQKRFLKTYIIKEALLTSEIENIHTTLIDVLNYRKDEAQQSSKSTQLVINYIDAVERAVTMITKESFPITSRVIRESHAALLSNTGNDHACPGEFRKQQVRVGKLIPPPAKKVPDLMAQLEQFINEDLSVLPLIKAGLAHAQFETIHPFYDGNGRIGRLLIVLMLLQDDLLAAPLLYPSYYFKKYQSEYYTNLDGIRTHGDWERWINYYLRAINQTAIDAYKRAIAIQELEENILQKIASDASLKFYAQDLETILSLFFQLPVLMITEIAEKIDRSYNTTKALVEKLIQLNVLTTDPTVKRNKKYVFTPYLELLEKDY